MDKPELDFELTPVKSSNIEAVGYDAGTNRMAVRFKGGGTYIYDDVSEAAHSDFVSAKSVGAHFHENIRGTFKHSKLETKLTLISRNETQEGPSS